MVNIPDSVILDGNEAAYVRGAMRNIARNAAKTTAKRAAADPEFASLLAFIQNKAVAGSKFFNDMQKTLDERGKLSEKQEETCARIMREEAAKKAEFRARDAGSVHVGTIGERRMFTLTLTAYKMLVNSNDYYDLPPSHLHIFKDQTGNVLIYKGNKLLSDERGATVTFKATIKSHDERDGVKSTKLARPA